MEDSGDFLTPPGTELFSVTVRLVEPTVATFGTAEQQARVLRPLRRAEILACQLFSEPGAGSDLANLSCRAVHDGDEWVVTGQKVWTSGAPHAAYGELIARTDVDVPKHKGLTAFLVPLDAPGVEIRPIRRMDRRRSYRAKSSSPTSASPTMSGSGTSGRLAGGAHHPGVRTQPLRLDAPAARRHVRAAGRRGPALRPG